MTSETHFGRLEFTNDHSESSNDRIASRVEVGDTKVRSNAKRENKAGEDDQKDGKELGRVGKCAPESDHVEAEDLQLLDVEREGDEGTEHGYRAVRRLDVVGVGEQGYERCRIGEQLEEVLKRQEVRQAVDEHDLAELFEHLKVEQTHEQDVIA